MDKASTSAAVGDPSATDNEETSQERKACRINLPNDEYQVKMLMYLFMRGVRHGVTFSMDTEVSEFDDAVFTGFKTGIEEKDREYRLLQAKHRLDEMKKITVSDLLQETGGDFGMLKYFSSYLKTKNNQKFNGKIIDLTICTNVDVDAEVLQSLSDVDCGKDELLSHKPVNNCKLYKIPIKSDIYDELVALFQKHHPNITDKDIDEFFDKLKLAVNQPNNIELVSVIADEIADNPGKLIDVEQTTAMAWLLMSFFEMMEQGANPGLGQH